MTYGFIITTLAVYKKFLLTSLNPISRLISRLANLDTKAENSLWETQEDSYGSIAARLVIFFNEYNQAKIANTKTKQLSVSFF